MTIPNMGMTQFSNGTTNFLNSLISLSKSDAVGGNEESWQTIKDEFLTLNGADPEDYRHLVLDGTMALAIENLPDIVVQLH